MEIGPCAEGSPDASDDPDPERLISVETFPHLRNFPAGGFVDRVELLRPVQTDLDDAFVGEGHMEMSKA